MGGGHLVLLLVLAALCGAQEAGPLVGPESGPYAPPEVLRLTVQDAVEMTLQNNVDIAIQRFPPQIAAETIEFRRGIYDPTLTLGFTAQRSERPSLVGDVLLGSTKTDQRRFTSSLSGRLPSGTEYRLVADMTRFLRSGDKFADYIGRAGLELRQPLLRDFGLLANQAQIWVARKDKERADHEFVLRILDIIRDTHNAYYDMVFALDQVRVQQEALTLAKTLLVENKKKLEVGLLSPLEVTQAEAGVARAESDLILAQRTALNQENQLRLLIFRDVYKYRKTRLEPAEVPAVLPLPLDVDESIRQGLQHRPDYRAAIALAEREKITLRFQSNQTLPTLDLVASYFSNSDRVSFEDSVSSLVEGKTPTQVVGVEFNMPLFNRQATANYRIARLNVAAALEQLKKVEQLVMVEVDNAVGTVESNYKRVEATRNARRYAEESLRAEQTKFNAGASTSFLVLQAQQQLTAARAEEIRAIADYNKSVAEMYRAEGTLLKRYNINLRP